MYLNDKANVFTKKQFIFENTSVTRQHSRKEFHRTLIPSYDTITK